MKEVEIKVSISYSEIERIKDKLIEIGIHSNGLTEETDFYFTSLHKDFILSRECLRIRARGNYKEITYKGPTTKQMEQERQFWKAEFNIEIEKSTPTDDLIKFFEMLDFRMVAEVAKKREKYTLGNTEVCIDEIRNLGFFVEIETMISENDDTEIGIKKNLELFEVLGLDKNNIIQEPYRDLVIKKQVL